MSYTRSFGVLATATALLATPFMLAAGGRTQASAVPQAAPQGTQAATSADLAAAVRQAIAATGLKKASICVSVRDMVTGRVLADVNGDQPMLPASNMKVLTTGAALHTLGADFTFRTRLLRNGDQLVVVGDGDPSFGDPVLLEQMVFTDPQGNQHRGMTVDGLLDYWVDAVKRAGVTQVRELVVDDRVFDRQFTHPTWPADQLDNAYCAQISGLMFHTNLLHAYIAAAGGRAELTRWEPAAPWLRVVNKSAAATKKNDSGVWVGRTDDASIFTLNGHIKSTLSEPVAVCVNDMPAFFARLLAERLRAAGVTVGNARTAAPTDPAANGTVLGPVIQTPLRTVVQRCNTDSQNMYAESLLKRIGYAKAGGAPGSWTNGAQALAAAIDERLGAGSAAKWLVVSDGSGLSRGNRVAPHLVTAWLRSIGLDSAMREAFIESLAVAGETGTVSKRFKDLDTTKVFAPCKTGYINGVSCLSGFVGPVGGQPRYAYSILCNDLTEPNAVGKAKQMQERVVKALANAL